MDRHVSAMSDHVNDKSKVWYLEVLAVSPKAQGRGAGGRLLSWLLGQMGDSSCILECTAAGNVPLYEKYGFRTVEKVELRDGQDSTIMWLMVRRTKTL